MARSTIFSSGYGLILNFVLVVVLNIHDFAEASPVHRLPTCSPCTDADRARCPVVKPGPECEVIEEPNCGCCKMCAKKAGEKCGAAAGFCESGLECIPPPRTPQEYEFYGPADYLLEIALGEFICVTREDFCKMLSGAAYDDSSNIYDGNLYVPELCPIIDEPILTSDFLPSHSYSEEPPTENSKSNSNNKEPVTDRPVSPPEAPYQDIFEPCNYHSDQVWSKEEFDHHEWIPACRKDGSYFPEQCELTFGQERGRCWCVDRVGIPVTKFIPGDEAYPSICISHKINA